jgi:hypothetical protein
MILRAISSREFLEMHSRCAGETPTTPRAAATANVSRPSGRIRAMSVATTEREPTERRPKAHVRALRRTDPRVISLRLGLSSVFDGVGVT